MNFGFSLYKNTYTKIFLLGLLALILTFPAFDMSFSFGIDPCLPWVFHHIQQAGFDKGQDIIFPYGPLTFLMYPLYINPLPALFTYIFLALSFYFLLTGLMMQNGTKSWVLPFLFSVIILTVSGFNLLLFSVIAVSYLTYLKSEKAGYLIFGLILSTVGVFIKINVAILSGILTFVVLLYVLFKKRSIPLAVSGIFIIVVSMLLLWLGMYGNFNGFIKYFIGLLHLASGNSSATALFPDNNWLYLSLSLVFLVITFILIRNRHTWVFALIFFLPFFAAWKHGIGRQDSMHYLQFLHFTLILILLLFAFTQTKKIVSILSGLTVVIFLYLNFSSIKSFPDYSFNLIGPVTVYNLITDYKEIKEEAEIRSSNNIKFNKLSDKFREKISTQTVDIYPWDYSIIAANDLNWIPRPGLQSFLGYSTRLDRRNKEHFRSEVAPEYIIWHYNPFNSDVNPGRMESVDERYLLNDEPLTLVSILENYEWIEKSEDFVLFRKRTVPLRGVEQKKLKDRLGWNEWLPLSEIDTNYVIKINTEFRRNLTGKLINFLYKDTPVYMVAETSEGFIYRYRIAPGNSRDGIWLNPLLQDLSSESCPYHVEKIMFQAGDLDRMKKDIYYEIKLLSFITSEGEQVNVKSLFDKVQCLEKEIVFAREKKFSSGEKIIDPDSYAGSVSFSPDWYMNDEFWIQVVGFVKPEDYPDVKLVLEIFDGDERQVYNSASFSGFYIDSDERSPVQISQRFESAGYERPLIKAYFWNASDHEIELGSLKMQVVRIPDP